MPLGMIGFGQMSASLIRHRRKDDCTCIGDDDRNRATVTKFADRDVQDVASLDEFITNLSKPNTAWVIVPGETDGKVASRRGASGTIDGDNTDDRGNLKRAKILKSRSIHSVGCDALGKENGIVKHTEPVFKSLTPMIVAGPFWRFESRGEADYVGRLLSAMRKQFGGHDEKKEEC